MTPKEYDALVRQLSPKSPIWKDTALAFLVGGGICVIGQLILNGWSELGLAKDDAATATSVTLVFLSVLATALGLYHRLARYAGAGTLVPITGFANAVASPAIDFRAEGLITGTAVKMFTVAGPVIEFGTAASADRNTSVTDVAVPASAVSSPSVPYQLDRSCPTVQMAPPTRKASTVSLTMGDGGDICLTSA